MKKIIPLIILSTGVGLLFFTFTNCDSNHRRLPTSLKSELDKQLDNIIAANALTPLSAPGAESPALVALGKELFNETAMSGLNDTSCATCHEDNLGSGDGLPFSIGSGATGTFPNRRQINGQSIPMKRHSMTLFNKGRDGVSHALWDGRLNIVNGVVNTPVPELSGPNPARADITSIMENAFDIQPLFPIISTDEFLGSNNPLANLVNPIVILNDVLFTRLLTQPKYVTLFDAAYGIPSANLNPGHIARAIRAFIRTKFLANNSPFDKYLAGDIHAMTVEQKLGMRTFYTNGACNICHAGNTFTNDDFEGIATPEIGFTPFEDDLGREQATGNAADKYLFKVPGLRNVKLSAPFMHNGAFDTVTAVVEHYSNVEASLNNYSIPQSYQQHYDQVLTFDNDSARNQLRIDRVTDPRVKSGLNLRPEDKRNLIDFLENALLDETFKSR